MQSGQEQVKASQAQVAASQDEVRLGQEQLVAQQRPVLIPMDTPIFQEDHDNWLNWEAKEQLLAIRNLGTGTAFNVASVLFGCASYLHDSLIGRRLRSHSEAREHWTYWLGVPIAAGEQGDGPYKFGYGTFNTGNDRIGKHSFNAPDEETPGATSLEGALWTIARVTITYHDIAGRKYASIFDWVHNRGWHTVEVLRDIDRDLHDLEGYSRTVPASSVSITTEDDSTE